MGEFVFRPATVADIGFWSDLETAYKPDEPSDPVQKRYEWETRDAETHHEDFVVSRSGDDCAFAGTQHKAWDKMPERFARVGVLLRPDLRSPSRWAEIYDFIEGRARGEGARILVAGAREDDDSKIDALQARGFEQKRLEKTWELDLVANRERLLKILAPQDIE